MARSRAQSAIRNPLTRIFGVDSNVAVLRELVRHGGYLSSSTVQSRSGLSKSSVRLGLISLEQTGIVITEGTPFTKLHRFIIVDKLNATIRLENRPIAELFIPMKW